MQAEARQPSALERRLDIAFPLKDIETEVDTRLKRLVRTAKFPGFRPGKVPLKIVAQQHGGRVRQEVIADSLQRAFSSAVKEQNLRVAGYPRFEPKEGQQDSERFEFVATFEIYPEVSLGELANATVRRPVTELGDEEIDKTIEILRRQRTKWNPVTRAADSGDQIVIDYQGSLDGVPFEAGAAQDQTVVLGEGRLHAGFESQLLGLSGGESKTFDITFPEDYPGKEVAGKTVAFTATLKSVAEPELPAVDADFARALGVKTGEITQLRDEVRANLEREMIKRTQSKVKEQVMQALLDSTKLEVPNALVELEVRRLMQNAMNDLQARGRLAKNMTLPPELFTGAARRRAALGLIISEVLKRNQLEAKSDQVRALIEEHAKSYEQPQAMVDWYYQHPQRLREAEAVVIEDNVVSWALSQVKVEEVATPFDELMGNTK